MHLVVFALGIILFIGLVLVHEWGHFIMARRNGVTVEEFGLGFPPRLASKKLKSGMRLSYNLLPLGGFVKMKGENDSDERKGSFGAASLGAKTKIMLAGVTMNLLAGLALLTFLALIGMPKLLTADTVGQDQFTVASDTKVIHQQVLAGDVLQGTPADKLGLKNNDTILSISDGKVTKQVQTPTQLHDATTAFAGQEVVVNYQTLQKQNFSKTIKLNSLGDLVKSLKSDAKISDADKVTKITKDKTVYLTPNDQALYGASQKIAGENIKITYLHNGRILNKPTKLYPEGYLGLAPTALQIQRSTWSAPIVAVGLTKQIVVLTFKGLGHAIEGLGSLIAGGVTGNHQARVNGGSQASSQVGGPVAIGVALWDYGNLGINFMLILIALISLTLALMNVLPIPALDGGRLAMMLISRGIFKRPLSRSAEEKIVGTSFAFLLALIVLITVVDVKRFF